MTPSMAMKKDDLIAEAAKRGLDIDPSQTKEVILDAIMAHDITTPIQPQVDQAKEGADETVTQKIPSKKSSKKQHPKFHKFKGRQNS